MFLSEALTEELKDTNVSVTCLCTGPVDTELFEYVEMKDARAHDPLLMMKPEQVAEDSYKGLMNRERIAMPGFLNRAMTFTCRIMPKEIQNKLQKQFCESKEE